MFYMVNPSKLNKKKFRSNPELLIVNPFEGAGKGLPGRKSKEERKMALKKAKRRLARRNPTPMETAKKIVNKDFAVNAAVIGLGGGAATAFGAMVVGNRLGESKLAPVGVALAGGILGAIVLDQLGERMQQPLLSQAAMPVATGALALSVWELGREPVLSIIDRIRVGLGLATQAPVLVPVAPAAAPQVVEGWDKEFSGLGQSYHDEFPKAKKSRGLKGYEFGAGPTPELDASQNPYLNGLGGGYEQLGDLYNTQRLGSFEAEGLGSFSPEEANVMHQQINDKAKHKAGMYGELADAESLFQPFIHD